MIGTLVVQITNLTVLDFATTVLGALTTMTMICANRMPTLDPQLQAMMRFFSPHATILEIGDSKEAVTPADSGRKQRQQ